MPSVGEQLASARQSKDWSMEDVARLTKLRTDQVLAIEEGRYQVFSAPVYVRGSVKSYA
ncbi:MAG: helix-turn-helix domain-containing protein, partial [Limisphaerales bacterium]